MSKTNTDAMFNQNKRRISPYHLAYLSFDSPVWMTTSICGVALKMVRRQNQKSTVYRAVYYLQNVNKQYTSFDIIHTNTKR